MYLVLEIERLLQDWVPDDMQSYWQQVRRNLIDFGIDSVMNLVWAMGWPAFYRKAYRQLGMTESGAAAAGY